jgi:hypothetical protein
MAHKALVPNSKQLISVCPPGTLEGVGAEVAMSYDTKIGHMLMMNGLNVNASLQHEYLNNTVLSWKSSEEIDEFCA